MRAPPTFAASAAIVCSLLTATQASADVGFQDLYPFRMGLLIDLGYGKLDSAQSRS